MTRDLLWGKLVAVKWLVFDDDQVVKAFKNINEELQLLDNKKMLNRMKTPEQFVRAIERGRIFDFSVNNRKTKDTAKDGPDPDLLDLEKVKEYLKKKVVRKPHITNIPKNFLNAGSF